MNNSIPERFIFQCALFKNLEREVGFAPIFPDTCYHLTHYWP
ncbi:hypothetical protein N5V60_12210, partial [Escherichia coli]|nr:hypothetical protein [Escherichia coli]